MIGSEVNIWDTILKFFNIETDLKDIFTNYNKILFWKIY